MTRADRTTRGKRRARRPVVWAGALAVASVVLLGMSGCGGSSSGDAGGPLDLQWVFTPSPATAVASSDAAYDWMVPYRVTLTETGGDQGATISSVVINIYENVGGEPGAEATAGNTTLTNLNNRIDSRGELALDFTTRYTLASGGQAALVDVFIFLVDDEGRQAQIGRRLEVQ